MAMQVLPGPVSTAVSASLVTIVPKPGQFQSSLTTQQSKSENMKMKCKNFFVNLLCLCNKESQSVKIGVKELIQDLIDERVMPIEFCNRLESLLNATPQPAIIGFLTENLPLLRRALYTKELSIEGINPPTSLLLPTPTQGTVEAKLRYIIFQKLPSKSNSTTTMLQSTSINKTMNVKTVPANCITFTKPTLLFDTNSASKAEDFSQTFTDSKMEGLDDINDVSAMGGVNLAEETQNILKGTNIIGTLVRSCTDEYLIPTTLMQSRIKAVTAKHGLDMPSVEVAAILSHAVQNRLKTLLEKMVVIAKHRTNSSTEIDNRYEITKNVGSQLKFLQEVDMRAMKRKENLERELMLKVAKSRSHKEDPEYCQLREKAKEKQRAELEEIRRRDANMTALQAIGPRKKRQIESAGGEGCSATVNQDSGTFGDIRSSLRPRVIRITQRDMIYLLEQEKDTAHSLNIFRSWLN